MIRANDMMIAKMVRVNDMKTAAGMRDMEDKAKVATRMDSGVVSTKDAMVVSMRIMAANKVEVNTVGTKVVAMGMNCLAIMDEEKIMNTAARLATMAKNVDTKGVKIKATNQEATVVALALLQTLTKRKSYATVNMEAELETLISSLRL